MNYDKSYIDEQIRTWGKIEEPEPDEIICPYCGFIKHHKFKSSFDDKIYFCQNCNKDFILTYETGRKNYFISKRIYK